MNDKIETLIRRLRDFLDINGEKQALAQLDHICGRRGDEKYRVALVGGVSRGKTRILNNLLDTDIFPESGIPTTTMLTEVAWAKEKYILWQCGDKKEKLPVEKASLERFSAEEADADKTGMLKVGWPASFLEPGLALFDTPGIDDVMTARASITYDILETADAALVVIAASAPVSLLEKSFIATYLENRAIAHIAVVIAFLDTFRKDDIASQIQFIAKKMAAIDSHIELWSSHDYGDASGSCVVRGVEAMRQRLDAWSRDEDRANQRDCGYLTSCQRLLDNCLARLRATITALATDQQGREKALLLAYEKLDLQKDEWTRLRGDFLSRAKDVSIALDGQLEKLRAGIEEAFAHEPSDKFRMELRPRLSSGARDLAELLRQRLIKDTRELQEALGQKFDLTDTSAISIRHDFALGCALPDLPDQNVGDILVVLVNFARILWRDIEPMLPVPLVFRGRARELFDNGLDRISKFLSLNMGASATIQETIQEFFVTLKQQLGRSLHELYSETAEHAREEQIRWIREQRELLVEAHTPSQLQTKLRVAREQLQVGNALKADLEGACQLYQAAVGSRSWQVAP